MSYHQMFPSKFLAPCLTITCLAALPWTTGDTESVSTLPHHLWTLAGAIWVRLWGEIFRGRSVIEHLEGPEWFNLDGMVWYGLMFIFHFMSRMKDGLMMFDDTKAKTENAWKCMGPLLPTSYPSCLHRCREHLKPGDDSWPAMWCITRMSLGSTGGPQRFQMIG